MALSEHIRHFRRARVLVVGDLMLDRYIWGRVERISPEAPVPVVEVLRDSYNLGGAANVAANVVSLGARATVLGVVGTDLAGQTLEQMLRDRAIQCALIEDRRPTTVKTRVIAHNQQVVRFDTEDRAPLRGRELQSLLGMLGELLPGHDVVVVSDYKKGVVSAPMMKALLRMAGRKPIAVDPKIGHFHLYKGVSVLTPNLKEASQGSGVEIRDERTLLRAGRRLRQRLGAKAVLITRGERGMSLFEGTKVWHIPTVARRVYDVTGAGDTVIATLVVAWAAGASLRDAAVLANHAAGLVVAEVGAATTTAQALRASLRKNKEVLSSA